MSDVEMLTRREVVRRALAGAGATLFLGSTALINTACAEPAQRTEAAADLPLFSASDIAWLDEVAETILPETETPGAKAAEVGSFIALMVHDTYSPDKRALFNAGMTTLEAECRAETGVGFLAATPEQRLGLLTRLDQEAFAHSADDPHYFRLLKELTTLGYFTSEIGYTQAMRYVETPGRFDPCVEFTPGEKVWARHA